LGDQRTACGRLKQKNACQDLTYSQSPLATHFVPLEQGVTEQTHNKNNLTIKIKSL
jgi:hypothetical protein